MIKKKIDKRSLYQVYIFGFCPAIPHYALAWKKPVHSSAVVLRLNCHEWRLLVDFCTRPLTCTVLSVGNLPFAWRIFDFVRACWSLPCGSVCHRQMTNDLQNGTSNESHWSHLLRYERICITTVSAFWLFDKFLFNLVRVVQKELSEHRTKWRCKRVSRVCHSEWINHTSGLPALRCQFWTVLWASFIQIEWTSGWRVN